MTPLWPHQQNAVTAAVNALADGGRTQVIMACGTGKTRVAAETADQLAPAGRVLIFVPSLELLAQTAAAVAGWGRAGRIIAVCGDNTITTQAQHAHQELDGMGAPVTTDPQTLATLTATPGRVTVFATYQSMPVIVAAHRDHGLPPWDLIVADEAHRTAGRSAKPWAAIHSDEAIPAHRRLYLTATPRVGVGGASGAEVASMDDPELFGLVAYHMPFGAAIDTGLLADFRVVVAVVTDTSVAQLLADRRHVSTAAHTIPARMLAGQIALARAIEEHGLRRVITYHARVADARRFAGTLNAAVDQTGAHIPPVDARSIDATTRPEVRRDILDRLRTPAGVAVVANCRVLTEGVDVPALDAVMFADPRDSTTDVIQAVGRALRRGPDTSKVATIVVPILAAADEDPDAAADSAEWAGLWRVIRALRAHDERLDQNLRHMQGSLRTAGARGPELPSWLWVTGVEVDDTFAAAVQLRMVRSTALVRAWADWLDDLVAYRAEHDSDPPAGWRTPEGHGLGTWLVEQRIAYRQRRLPADRAAAMEVAGVDWHPDTTAWRVGLAHATAWRAEHGHLAVPMRHRTSDGYALGDWLVRQRQSRRTGRRTLTDAQIAALDALGMVWDHADQAWQEWIRLLSAYRAEHGTANVPREHVTGDGAALGTWLSQQRGRRRRGSLAPDRVVELEQAGVVWDPVQEAFEAGLAGLARFRAEHGHSQVPAAHVAADGQQLGRWVRRQRGRRWQRDGRNGLTDAQIAALDALDMRW